MKTIAISMLAVVMMMLGVGRAWAVCQDDDTACYCAHHPGECDDAPPPPPDYSAAAASAAWDRAHTMTTATPLGIQTGCYAGNSLGNATCGVVIYFQGINGDVAGGILCDVTVGIDGWGNTEVTDVSCTLLYPPPHDNGGCTGGQCG